MIRIGHGLDVHPFDESRPLVLGSVRISETGGLLGHSDADVVLHALTDAILGAIGAGDIGEHFSSDDPRWEGMDSKIFVLEAKRLLAERGGAIQNVDITVIAAKPRIAPYRETMRIEIAQLLEIPPGRVNVKATSTDHLGFIGRAEGICAMAVACVEIAPEG